MLAKPIKGLSFAQAHFKAFANYSAKPTGLALASLLIGWLIAAFGRDTGFATLRSPGTRTPPIGLPQCQLGHAPRARGGLGAGLLSLSLEPPPCQLGAAEGMASPPASSSPRPPISGLGGDAGPPSLVSASPRSLLPAIRRPPLRGDDWAHSRHFSYIRNDVRSLHDFTRDHDLVTVRSAHLDIEIEWNKSKQV